MKSDKLCYDSTSSCDLFLLEVILSMSPEIVSIYTKVWTTGFSVTFLHDSAHCTHCHNGGICITPPRKRDKQFSQGCDPPEKEAASQTPKSFFHEARLQELIVKEDSIPESCFSPLGIKVTAPVVAKLKQDSEFIKIPDPIATVKRPINTKDDCNKTVLRRFSKRNICKGLKSPCRACKTCDNEIKKYPKAKRKKNLQEVLLKSIISRVKTPIVKVPSKNKLQNETHKSPNKKSTPPKSRKVSANKEPTKGTLKRKRWQLDKLKQNNANYEDDLFEDQKFYNFETVMEEDSSDSESYEKMLTPKISLSPVRESSSSPSYQDCYSPGELSTNRKEAEEYLYRREKRRKMKLLDERINGEETSLLCYKNSENYTSDTLEKSCKILNKVALKEENADSEEEKDYYFSDVSSESD